jgi:hypothetical protein
MLLAEFCIKSRTMKKTLLTTVATLALSAMTAQTNFFTPTCYRGAFAPAPTPMWTEGWTNWDPNATNYPAPTVTVTGNITANTTWSTGSTVLLSSQVYVKNNAVLTIQPGVVVLGDKSVTGAGLFITKGSQLVAIGTASQPIVFTSNQPAGQRSLGDWGGVILLGKAPINSPNGINFIEGLPQSSDTEYGGGTSADANDNSGTLKYVRIEYGGYVYQPDKEINGLTFGGVGRGTTIDFVQVSFSNDDAYEWFGGTVSCKHLVSYRNLDDDFDTDFGFSGMVQFGIAIRDPQIADNPNVSTSEAFESDNDASGSAATPQTSGIFCNMTLLGPLRGVATATYASGFRRGARIRRNSTLKIYNSIFMDHATRGVYIDGSACETNANSGLLKFKNNIVAGYGQRATETGTFGIITGGANTWIMQNANDTLKSSANILTTPYNFTSPDYRPAAGSIALSNISFTDAALSAATNTAAMSITVLSPTTQCVSNGSTITPMVFSPASTVVPGYCSLYWSTTSGVAVSSSVSPNPTFTISAVGNYSITLTVVVGTSTVSNTTAIVTTTCSDVGIQSAGSISALQLFPNPAAEAATLKFYAAANDVAAVNMINVSGQKVYTSEVRMIGGENVIELPTAQLENGLYFVQLNTPSGNVVLKMVVNH